MRAEDQLAQQIATYLNMQYPAIIYHFDTGSGGALSIGMAMRNKRLNKWRGYPDLFIAEPMNGRSGLFIELKVKDPFKKDGSVKKNDHFIEQDKLHLSLQQRGYSACFAVGFDETIKIINHYLNQSV